VGGSFSRTSVNRLSGGRTRWSGAITGLVVVAFLPFAWVLAPLPRAVLSAIVIGAVFKLVALGDLLKLRRFSLPQAAIGWTTFGLTLALAPRVDQAIIVGIGLAGVVHIWRELQVGMRTSYAGGVLKLEPQGVLFFGSAPGLEEALVNQVAEHPDAVRVVLDLEELGRIDYTGAIALKSVVQESVDAGLGIEVRHVPPHAARILNRVFGPEQLALLTGLPGGSADQA
jgi:SulP family sulfate permease